jgi:DNA processing protein
MTEKDAVIALNMVSGVGSSRLKRLLEAFGSASRIFLAPGEALRKAEGIGNKIAGEITGFRFENLKKELDLAEKLKVKIITIHDKEYPGNLKSIYDPPLCLYVKGELLESDMLSLAVVGSRRASFYGLSCAEKFSYALANLGVTIVSGLARGVDTQTHKGALKARGRTIAVLGSGLNCIYPCENKKLAEEIALSAAVISEFPLNAKPLAQNFPRRNRVISGLSQGVIVVEAAKNSGALITADFALEQGRDVFAIPGKVDSATSFGTNQLIKQGAKLVDSIEDIIEELKPKLNECIGKQRRKGK